MPDDVKSAILRSIVFFTRSRIYHRVINKELKTTKLRSNFWIISGNNHLDIAVIEWCKLFGNRKNTTHWKKNVTDKKAFRNGLLAQLKLSQNQWDEYCASVLKYRNKEVAHFDPGFSPRKVPRLDIGFRAMEYA